MTIQALYIPADFNQKPVITELESLKQVDALVNGTPEQARYDRDAIVWVHHTSSIDGQPHNYGASDYTAQYSEAGRNFADRHGYPPNIDLHGDIVITGRDGRLPARVIDEWPNAVEMTSHALLNQIDETRRTGLEMQNRLDRVQRFVDSLDEDYGYGY